MTGFWFDLRSALRALAASRGVAVTAVLTLGAGLALAVLVLAVLNAYIVRPLPYPDADRLYRIDYGVPGGPQADPGALGGLDWRSFDDVFEHAIAWDLDVFYLLGGGSAGRGGAAHPESAPGAWVTESYVRGLGLRAALGRVLSASDYDPAAAPVAMISHRLWRERYGGDPGVLGRTFTAYVSDRPDDPESFTIVGVLPEGGWHFDTYTEVLAPLRARTYPYLATLGPGVEPDAVAARLTAFVRAGSSGLPGDWRVVVTGLQRHYTAAVRPMLASVGVVAALVLLIAGANVAVLLLVRGARRQQDLAVRAALGASPGRLARLLALEGLLLGAGATVVALIASSGALGWLGASAETFLGRRVPGGPGAFVLDATVLAWSAVCAVVVTIVFTIVPLVPAWSARLSPLFSASRGATESRARRRVRAALIGVEVAASLTLVSGAALMVASATRMLALDLGLDAARVESASLSLRQRSYPDAASQAVFFDRLTRRIEELGAGSAVAIANWWPQRNPALQRVAAADREGPPAEAGAFSVTGGYFAALGIPLHDGRPFDARDTADGEPVAIVSAALARQLWPGERAVGQQLNLGPASAGAGITRRRVVGVAADVRQSHLDTSVLDVYLPFVQQPGRFASIYLRDPVSASWPAEIRRAAGAVDPEAAVGAPRRLAASFEQERARPQFLAAVLVVFAAAALVIAVVGLYGVMTYAARQRRREIAIRLAMGATRDAVTRLFLKQGAVVIAGGMLAGLWGAVAMGRLLDAYLFGVAPADPSLLAAAAAVLAVTGVAAIWRPAVRAAALDPARVLAVDQDI